MPDEKRVPVVGGPARTPDRAVFCYLARWEISIFLGVLENRPQLSLRVIATVDGSNALDARRSDGWFAPDGLLSIRSPDLIVLSDHLGLLGRDILFRIVRAALDGAVLCRLSRLRAASPDTEVDAVDPDIARHLLGVLEANAPAGRTKRAIDVALASLGLLLGAPLFLLIALAVRLDSPGPVFFVQERLGQGRRPFRCIKFRTMCHDAERDTGPVWATGGDSRITRIGRLLRRSRLDELPQLVNVVRGEMSLVGTRPIRAHFADELASQLPFYDVRFLEKPGITGWAQVKYHYSSSFREQIEKFYYDCYYICNRSLFLDFYIMALTVWTVMRMRGT